MEISHSYGRIERLKKGDYPSLLVEISAYMLTVPRTSLERNGINQILGLLNHSYNIFGEGSVSSELAWEVRTIPKELEDPNPMFRINESIRTFENGFEHHGYAYGFNYFEKENAVVIRFTDNRNPFQVINPDGPPEITRTYHVPVMVPHSVSMVNGYEIESAPEN